jgi:hypothetical protein
MKTIIEILNLYMRGYRILAPSDFYEETNETLYYLVNKINLGSEYVKKEDHIYLISIGGYKIIRKNNISQYIG